LDEFDLRVERLRHVDVFRDVPAAELRMLAAQGNFAIYGAMRCLAAG
jgi:hypothetical protein